MYLLRPEWHAFRTRYEEIDVITMFIPDLNVTIVGYNFLKYEWDRKDSPIADHKW